MAVKILENGKGRSNGNGHAPVRAALYARVSSDQQEQKHTIKTQLAVCEEWAKREKVEIVSVYADEAISGTVPFDQRPGAKRLLADAKHGHFSAVLVYNTDRLARGPIPSYGAIASLQACGLRLLSATEQIDPESPDGGLMMGVHILLSGEERRKIVARCQAGITRSVKEGKWPGGIVPFGYRRGTDGFLHIYEEEAEIVREIFRWSAAGVSTFTIAERLNERGILTHVGTARRPPRQWRSTRVGNLLRQTLYMGQHVYGRRATKGRELITRTVPAIVTPELWEQAKEQREKNERWAQRNGKRDYLLRGLLKCGFCGRSLIGSAGVVRGSLRRYYRCSTQHPAVRVVTGDCPSRHLMADWIERLVWEEIKDWILHYTNLEEVVIDALRRHEEEKQQWHETLARLRHSLASKQEERTRILTVYRKGRLTESDLEQQMAEIEQESAHIREAIHDLETRHNLGTDLEQAVAAIRTQLAAFRKAVKRETLPSAEKRRIVETLVKEIRPTIRKGKEPLAVSTIETVPYRADLDDLLPEGERLTVWQRTGTPQVPEDHRGTVQILYRFPFLPKAQEIAAFGTRTVAVVGD